MSVLVLADDVDVTADQVVRALGERGVHVDRVNTAWFPAELRLSARLRAGRWSGGLRTPVRTVELEAVTAVWYRQPRAYRFPFELSPAERAHANLEAKYGLGGVLASLPALWVNHPGRLADAAYKPRQLIAAHQCGLDMPDTLITQDAEAVRSFAAEGATVTKILGANTILEEGVRKVAFTRVVGDDELADLRGVDVTTHLFQRWVPKAYEARVIVIGGHVTAAAIHADTAASYVDWRADYDGSAYELVDPPADVLAGVGALMRTLDLRYAALDFVITLDDRWVFLESTPEGSSGGSRTGPEHPWSPGSLTCSRKALRDRHQPRSIARAVEGARRPARRDAGRARRSPRLRLAGRDRLGTPPSAGSRCLGTGRPSGVATGRPRLRRGPGPGVLPADPGHLAGGQGRLPGLGLLEHQARPDGADA